MPSIFYEKVNISEEKLQRIQEAFDKAPPEKRMGLWYAKRHYSALFQDIELGVHRNYLKGPNSRHCTCGLVLLEEGEGAEEIEDCEGLTLDRLQRTKGHVDLMDCRRLAVAIIVRYEFVKLQKYLWEAVCQECSGYLTGKTFSEVTEFTKEHNQHCKRSLE